MRCTRLAYTLAALLALPLRAEGQQVYHTTLVTMAPGVAVELAEGFDERREKVWCVTKWDSAATRTVRGQPLTLLTITEVTEERNILATDSHVEMDPRLCRQPDGRAWPLLHSHPRGMCQASPGDNEAILQRMAPFDGILCGDRYAVWYFSQQLVTVLDATTRAQFGQTGTGENKP